METTKTKRVHITVPTDIYFVSGIRSFALDVTKNIAGLNQQWCHRLQTVTDELVNNAVEHGSAKNGVVSISFDIVPKTSLSICVSDKGGGKKVDVALLEKKVAEEMTQHETPSLSSRGRGLMIIHSWTDELSFSENDDGGVSVRVTKHIHEDMLMLPSPTNTKGTAVLLDV